MEAVMPPLALPPGISTAPVLELHEVRLCLCNINPRKAAGPDGVLGRVIKECADELAEVFATIFNLSLSLAWVHVSKLPQSSLFLNSSESHV